MLHAHICTACKEKGKQIVWIHGDSCQGVETAHKCPECGTLNWKKFLVEPGALPRAHKHGAPAEQETNLTDLILAISFVAIAAIALYCGYLYIRDRNAKLIAK